MTQEVIFWCTEDDVEVTANLRDLSKSGMIKNMPYTDLKERINLEIDSKNFRELINYCKYHNKNPKLYENQSNPTYVDPWDKAFIEKFMDKKTAHKGLLKLYFYADYLELDEVLTLISKTLVNLMEEISTVDAFREAMGMGR